MGGEGHMLDMIRRLKDGKEASRDVYKRQVYLYVINKIRFSHIFYLLQCVYCFADISEDTIHSTCLLYTSNARSC